MMPRFRPDISWGEAFSLVGSPCGSPLEIERRFALQFGYPHAVWFPFGRTAIRAFLETLETGTRQVAVSPFNCFALGAGIALAGWIPYYTDTERGGFNQAPEPFLEAVEEKSSGAGIVVSLWGIAPPADLGLCTHKPILHDYALRGLDPSPPALKDEDAVVYSLGWGKPLTGLRGAFLCGKNATAAQRWEQWRGVHQFKGNWLKDFSLAVTLKGAFHPALFRLVHSLSRKTTVVDRLRGKTGDSAALETKGLNRIPVKAIFRLGLAHLENRERIAQRRREQVRFYDEHLRNLSSVTLPPETPWLSHFPVRTENRDALGDWLFSHGIFASRQLFDRLLCDFPKLAGKTKGTLNNARELVQTTLHLPLFDRLTLKEQAMVVEQVRAWSRAQPMAQTSLRRERA